jgi:hypothetical protein
MEKQPHNRFSVGEAHDRPAALPIEIPNAIGKAAAHGADVSVETGAEQSFQAEIGRFLDPEVKLDATNQLSLMRHFWHRLGHKLPDLSTDQHDALTKAVEAHPDRRVVPAPFLYLAGRSAIAERARAFPAAKFKPGREALKVPGLSYTYGRLLRDPESTVQYGRTAYGLRYKTPSGEVVGREAYIAALMEAGQAIEANDGTTWVFPIIDPRVRIKSNYNHALNLHHPVNPVVTPEALIAAQLLYQAKGTPNRRWQIDIANEAVYKLDKTGNPGAVIGVAGVDWYRRQVLLRDWGGDFTRVGLHRWNLTDQRDSFGIRSAESGL